MSTAYIVVTVLAAAANIYAAANDFVRAKWLVGNMSKLAVPESWLPTLGILKAAGALGTADRYWRTPDWDGSRRWAHIVPCRCGDHAPPGA